MLSISINFFSNKKEKCHLLATTWHADNRWLWGFVFFFRVKKHSEWGISSISLPCPLYHFQSKQKSDVLQEKGPLCDISDVTIQFQHQGGSFSEINETYFNISRISCFGNECYRNSLSYCINSKYQKLYNFNDKNIPRSTLNYACVGENGHSKKKF